MPLALLVVPHVGEQWLHVIAKPLVSDRCRIGRGRECDVVLDDPTRRVSRVHATISRQGGSYVLTVNSRVNPVLVNSGTITFGQSVVLSLGDKIAIGDYVLRMVAVDDDVDESTPSQIKEHAGHEHEDPLLGILNGRPQAMPFEDSMPIAPEHDDPLMKLLGETQPIAPGSAPIGRTASIDQVLGPGASVGADPLGMVAPSHLSTGPGFGGGRGGSLELDHVHDVNLPFSSPDPRPGPARTAGPSTPPAPVATDDPLALILGEPKQQPPLSPAGGDPFGSLNESPTNRSFPDVPDAGAAIVPMPRSAAVPPTLRQSRRGSSQWSSNKNRSKAVKPSQAKSAVRRYDIARAIRQPVPAANNSASDVVCCTVFAPLSVNPRLDDSFLVQAFAHHSDQLDAVEKSAAELDEAARRRGSKTLESNIAYGSTLTFHLSMPKMTIAQPVQTLSWRGRSDAVQFVVGVTRGTKSGNTTGTVTISQDTVPIGQISFALQLKSYGHSKKSEIAGAARVYKKAFISYASSDRDEVLKRVQMLARLDIDYFQDVLSLAPGQRWEQQLYRYIDESDLFFLFWSSAAKASPWVMNEVRYAMRRKNGLDSNPPVVIPVIIEGPPPVTPPPELAHLHFNDYLLYLGSHQRSDNRAC